MANKKEEETYNVYVSLSKLSTFLDNLKNTFATLTHKHTISDLTDYKVDTELSATSISPVQNKVLDAEFDSIATAMNALETSVDTNLKTAKAYADSGDATTLSSAGEYTDNAVAQKSQVRLDESFLSTLNIHNVTQDEYDQMLENGTLDENALYLTPEDDIDLSIYATKDELSTKADAKHTHDDLYYTEEEVDVKLSTKSDANHKHSVSDISDLAVTATELNYMSGVTSNIQTQLDTKTSVQIITWGDDD